MPKQRYIYFLMCKNVIKIGASISPKHRVKSVSKQYGIDFLFLGVIPESDDVNENKIHSHFRSIRLDRELFSYTPELASFIQSYVVPFEACHPYNDYLLHTELKGT